MVEGQTSVNEAHAHGGVKTSDKRGGRQGHRGLDQRRGLYYVEVRKTGKDSFLSQVIELVRQAQESKSKTQDLANRAALWLTLIALSAGTITLFVWLAVMQMNFAFALERMVTVMVIACPHALGACRPSCCCRLYCPRCRKRSADTESGRI